MRVGVPRRTELVPGSSASPSRLLALLLVTAVGGCSGAISQSDHLGGDAGSPGAGRGGSAGKNGGVANGSGGSGGSAGDTGPIPEPVPGTRPLSRLTRAEYNNTLRDLLGDRTAPADAFPKEQQNQFGFDVAGSAGDVEVRRFEEAAAAAASRALTANFAMVAPCAQGASEESCAASFIEKFGRRAFRRPLQPAEKDEHLTLYRAVRAAPISFSHREAIEALVTAMLQSPRFLYRWEIVPGTAVAKDGSIALDGNELASQLSYTLWQSMPDDALFAAVDQGQLATVADLGKQARRMLLDAKARDGVSSLYRQLLDVESLDTIEKDATVYPAFNRALAQSMRGELESFVRWAVLEDGHFEALLTSPTAFVDGGLAKLYGVAAPAGQGLQKVTLDGKRPGLFTRAGFLTVGANTHEPSPIIRGKVLLTRFMCGSVPPPPADVDTSMPKTMRANPQTREKFEDHEGDPRCAACHKVMDPLGFAFESYDGIGAYRTMDAGRPVNTKGTYVLDDKSISFAGASDLLAALAASDQARACLASQWLRFGLGRDVADGDTAALTAAHDAFAANGYDMRDLIVALLTGPAFTSRVPSEGELK